jgi:hypothetical protein
MTVISITGKIGSGKDTAADIIKSLSPSYNWEVKKFAGKLKTVASILTGIPVEKFEDQEFKKTLLGKEWSTWNDHEEPVFMTVRDLLQKLGTEAMRDGLHQDSWINAMWADYKLDKTYPNWIITDTRFMNEVESVNNHDGILIRIKRDSGNTVGIQHISETALDGFTGFHYEINNNGTLEDLKRKLEDILILENLI